MVLCYIMETTVAVTVRYFAISSLQVSSLERLVIVRVFPVWESVFGFSMFSFRGGAHGWLLLTFTVNVRWFVQHCSFHSHVHVQCCHSSILCLVFYPFMLATTSVANKPITGALTSFSESALTSSIILAVTFAVGDSRDVFCVSRFFIFALSMTFSVCISYLNLAYQYAVVSTVHS